MADGQFFSILGANAGEVSERLVKFLEYVKSGYKENSKEPSDKFVWKLQKAV